MVYSLLKKVVKQDQISVSETELYRHSHDESAHTPVMPNVVVFPETTSDIQAILQIANEHEAAVTPYGAGSGLEGQVIPLQKGISLNLERMNRVIDFSPEDMIITVQPGITRSQLNEHINKYGLHFPIDPGADATIGGMTATNASGTTAVRYGVMRDQLLNIEVVLPDGRIIETGSHAKKSSSGYHLTGLFAGSEGTLGVISKITLQLHGIPEHVQAARCTFDTIEACAEAAYAVLASDAAITRMELVDAASIRTVNAYGDYHFPEAHSLFFEFDGTEASVAGQVAAVKSLMEEIGCDHWTVASTTKDRNELWRARHEMAYAYSHQQGKQYFITDVCVPISKLPLLVHYARECMEEAGIEGGILGHVGDGNFHTFLLFRKDDENEKNRALSVNEKLALKAIEVGGTCTGEHGVGIGKRKFQRKEHGHALDVMWSIKQLLDPKNTMNPGKIFESTTSS